MFLQGTVVAREVKDQDFGVWGWEMPNRGDKARYKGLCENTVPAEAPKGMVHLENYS